MEYSNKEILFRTCQTLVRLFRNQVEENRLVVHSRIFNYVLHPEMKYVHFGVSANVTSESKTHPEHVVPCAVLINEIFRLIEEKVLDDDEIASLLQKHCKIVTITKEEAKHIDSTLKLRSKMPPGWSFEQGDTYERLHRANIKIVPIANE
jgi:hypothetical protein